MLNSCGAQFSISHDILNRDIQSSIKTLIENVNSDINPILFDITYGFVWMFFSVFFNVVMYNSFILLGRKLFWLF